MSSSLSTLVAKSCVTRIAVCALFGLLTIGCGDRIDETSLVGRWEANNLKLLNQRGDDVLYLYADSTTLRVYVPPHGDTLEEHGHWSLERREDGYWVVLSTYSNVYDTPGTFRRRSSARAFELSRPWFGDYRLWIDRKQRHYYLHRPDESG